LTVHAKDAALKASISLIPPHYFFFVIATPFGIGNGRTQLAPLVAFLSAATTITAAALLRHFIIVVAVADAGVVNTPEIIIIIPMFLLVIAIRQSYGVLQYYIIMIWIL